MKVMILAAGLGKRMRPLTDQTPKPLLKVAGRYLIEFHLERLAESGFKEVVINTHWLGEQLPEALGSGERWGLKIHYAHEPQLLETAGGIQAALPFLDQDKHNQPFLVINGDVYTELNLKAWLSNAPSLDKQNLAYLALVENPDHHIKGDFVLDAETAKLKILDGSSPSFTYSGVALFHPYFFNGLKAGPSPLAPLLKKYTQTEQILGGVISDYWLDVGTPERFDILQERLNTEVSFLTK